jgi:hypothetical protein
VGYLLAPAAYLPALLLVLLQLLLLQVLKVGSES